MVRRAGEKRLRKGRSGIVTLISDFGLKGEYAGAMKGAILNVNPRCQVVDITHQIPAQDTFQASFILKNTYPYFPVGTVHLVVVDPGVGTQRKPVALKKAGHFFVGPDNGVFTFILAEGKNEGYEITRERLFLFPVSSTFHGRDIFGPVAGHLSLGMDPRRLGPRWRDGSGSRGLIQRSKGSNGWAGFSSPTPSAIWSRIYPGENSDSGSAVSPSKSRGKAGASIVSGKPTRMSSPVDPWRFSGAWGCWR